MNNKSNTIKVLIVDDHPVVRTGLTTMLYAFDDIKLIGDAGSGPEALARCCPDPNCMVIPRSGRW